MKSLLKLKDKLNRCLTIKAHPENFKLQRDQAFSKVFFFQLLSRADVCDFQ